MLVDKWMILRTKIVPTIRPHKNISTTRVIGGFVRTRQVSNTVPVTRRLDFKQALSTLQQFERRRRSSKKPTMGTKFFFFVGKVLGGLLIFESPWRCTAGKTHRRFLEYRCVTRVFRSLDRFHTIPSVRRKTSRRIYVVWVEI